MKTKEELIITGFFLPPPPRRDVPLHFEWDETLRETLSRKR